MTAPIVAFFNPKRGVGTTTLVYHLAWMLADLDHRVVIADLDPQADLTSMCVDESMLEYSVWDALRRPYGFVPKKAPPLLLLDNGGPALLPGDLAMSTLEDELAWPVEEVSAFRSVLTDAARQHRAEMVLVDAGPSLGSISRTVLLASDYIVIPVAADLISARSLVILGPSLRRWRAGWAYEVRQMPPSGTVPPAGQIHVMGYVVLDHGERPSRPAHDNQRPVNQIPERFRTTVLDQPDGHVPGLADDPYCLAQLKHYHGLMPLAQEARKPAFHLKPADGAFGGHAQAAQSAYLDFKKLASEILDRLHPVDSGD
jgi:hypothetical protein